MRYRVWWNGKMYYPDHEDKYYFFYLNQLGELFEFEHPTYEAKMSLYSDAIVMPDIGKVDNNGKNIYESDIVEWRAEYVTLNCIIEWNIQAGAWRMRPIGAGYSIPVVAMNDTNTTIIGNIYQNDISEYKELVDVKYMEK